MNYSTDLQCTRASFSLLTKFGLSYHGVLTQKSAVRCQNPLFLGQNPFHVIYYLFWWKLLSFRGKIQLVSCATANTSARRFSTRETHIPPTYLPTYLASRILHHEYQDTDPNINNNHHSPPEQEIGRSSIDGRFETARAGRSIAGNRRRRQQQHHHQCVNVVVIVVAALPAGQSSSCTRTSHGNCERL